MTLKCHRCQHENPNDAENCNSCGANLNDTRELHALSNSIEDNPMSDKTELDNKVDPSTLTPENVIDVRSESAPDDDVTSVNPVVDVDDDVQLSELVEVTKPVEKPELADTEDDPADAESVAEAAEDETHATARMPHMNDDDGLLHIGSVRFRGNLVLTDKDRGTIFRIENHELEEAIIGRLNAKTGYRPHVDFTDHDGKDRGISRRHATINQRGDLIFVTDHNSLNGTFLNGQRLVPEQARVVRDSDSLRIGHITLIVSFERPSPNS